VQQDLEEKCYSYIDGLVIGRSEEDSNEMIQNIHKYTKQIKD
jgi:hypothetical protein